MSNYEQSVLENLKSEIYKLIKFLGGEGDKEFKANCARMFPETPEAELNKEQLEKLYYELDIVRFVKKYGNGAFIYKEGDKYMQEDLKTGKKKIFALDKEE